MYITFHQKFQAVLANLEEIQGKMRMLTDQLRKKTYDLENWKKKLITSRENIEKSSKICKTAKRDYGFEGNGAHW